MRRHSGGAGGVSPPPAQRSDEATSLSDLIAGLAELDANGLRLQWRNHLGGTPPAHLTCERTSRRRARHHKEHSTPDPSWVGENGPPRASAPRGGTKLAQVV